MPVSPPRKKLRKTRPPKPIHLREHYVCHFTEYIASVALDFGDAGPPLTLLHDLIPDLCTELVDPSVADMQAVLDANPPAEGISNTANKMRELLNYDLQPWVVVGDDDGNPTVGLPTAREAYEEARVRMGIGSPFSGGRLSEMVHTALDMSPLDHFNYWETWNATP